MKTAGIVEQRAVFDDRDNQLLDFLRLNAGRAYTVKTLCTKFGYDARGNGSVLRQSLKRMLRRGLPVVTCHFGVLYAVQSNQLRRYRVEEIEKRIAALQRVRDDVLSVEKNMLEREIL